MSIEQGTPDTSTQWNAERKAREAERERLAYGAALMVVGKLLASGFIVKDLNFDEEVGVIVEDVAKIIKQRLDNHYG